MGFVHFSKLTHKCALFVKEWSSVATGKCLKRHGVPDNNMEAFSDLNLDADNLYIQTSQPVSVLLIGTKWEKYIRYEVTMPGTKGTHFSTKQPTLIDCGWFKFVCSFFYLRSVGQNVIIRTQTLLMYLSGNLRPTTIHLWNKKGWLPVVLNLYRGLQKFPNPQITHWFK